MISLIISQSQPCRRLQPTGKSDGMPLRSQACRGRGMTMRRRLLPRSHCLFPGLSTLTHGAERVRALLGTPTLSVAPPASQSIDVEGYEGDEGSSSRDESSLALLIPIFDPPNLWSFCEILSNRSNMKLDSVCPVSFALRPELRRALGGLSDFTASALARLRLRNQGETMLHWERLTPSLGPSRQATRVCPTCFDTCPS